ncbi:MAG: urate hydroxylase PuuD [Planctomycetes bacterium]|nr:urate hydroxylase PuuD [Planctomycetota bacterium]
MTARDLREWLEALLRWAHVFSAILWIGQTYLFVRLERRMKPAGEGGREAVWMVHGGGFFVLGKEGAPARLPSPLLWFKWEAASTWLTGAAILALTYYMGGLLVEPDQDYALGAAAGIGAIVLAWRVYDRLARTSLVERPLLLGAIALAALPLAHLGLRQVQSDRSAFLHVGALIGTIMAANVWLRILPAQRRRIAALREGRAPDPAPAPGPGRTTHNTYLAVPLVFLMVSNHFPVISYGSDRSPLVLAGLLLVGFVAAKVLRG